MNAEITWDLVMSEDMSFAEGCYRIENGPWQVITAFKREGLSQINVRNNLTWISGVTGMNIVLPRTSTINATVLLEIISDILGVEVWEEVHGPDSIRLR